MDMTLDDCVYALADLLDETANVDTSKEALTAALSITDFTVDQVVEQFTKDYACSPDVYVENIEADVDYPILDDGFDSL